MSFILNAIITTVVITVLGGGLGYLIWLRTRPKKETWNAKIYNLGEGIREPKISKEGKVLSKVKLSDLRPYALDVLEKVEKDAGITIFRLQKLNKVTPPVEGDVVDYWGAGNKEVSVLMVNGGCTLLRKGYDRDLGQIVFDPLTHSRINIIKSEMALRKDRLNKEKDILQAITPWIVMGIGIFGLIAITYLNINGYIQMAEHLERGTANMLKIEQEGYTKQLEIERIRTGVIIPPNPVGVQPTPTPEEIPLIE